MEITCDIIYDFLYNIKKDLVYMEDKHALIIEKQSTYFISNLYFQHILIKSGILPTIKIIELNSCNLKLLPIWLSYCLDIEDLFLSKNNLSSIDVFTYIAKANKMQLLDVSYNEFSKIPKYIDNFTCLQILRFDNNHLDNNKSLKLLGKLVNLIQLDLSYNLLEDIPEDVFVNLKLLKILNINHNKLTSLPKSLEKLNKLYHLGVMNNKLKKVPRLPLYIKYLNLSHNELQEIPSSLNKPMINLTTLVLSYNHIKKIPSWFFNLTSLVNLYLEFNEKLIIDIDHEFKKILNLKNLQEFSIENGNTYVSDCNLQLLLMNHVNYNNLYDVSESNSTDHCITDNFNE